MSCRSSTSHEVARVFSHAARREVRRAEGDWRCCFSETTGAEAHHDIAARRRRSGPRPPPTSEGAAGIADLHGLVAAHLGDDDEPDQVLVGIETDRGPWVQALIAAGYQVWAINPVQAAPYRERHGSSKAKSDPGDAHVLAEIVRIDRAHHRPVAGDSAVAEHVKVAARAHQTMIWTRQRDVAMIRSMLREYYPAALAALADDLAGRDALAVLAARAGPGAWPQAHGQSGRDPAAPSGPAALPNSSGHRDRGRSAQ